MPDGERICESCARSWRAVDPSTRNLSRTSRPLTPLSMNFRDSFSVEELVTGPVNNAVLDRSHFHPTCKWYSSCFVSLSGPRHFRFFELHAQPSWTCYRNIYSIPCMKINNKTGVFFQVYCYIVVKVVVNMLSVRIAPFRGPEWMYRFTEFRTTGIN